MASCPNYERCFPSAGLELAWLELDNSEFYRKGLAWLCGPRAIHGRPAQLGGSLRPAGCSRVAWARQCSCAEVPSRAAIQTATFNERSRLKLAGALGVQNSLKRNTGGESEIVANDRFELVEMRARGSPSDVVSGHSQTLGIGRSKLRTGPSEVPFERAACTGRRRPI